jgi:hypothetical protein
MPMAMFGGSLSDFQSRRLAWFCTSSMVSKPDWLDHAERNLRLQGSI